VDAAAAAVYHAPMDEAVWRRLRALLSFYSGAPEEQIGPEARRDNTPGWDSIANLSLMAAVEEEFQVTILTRDAIGLASLADIARFVAEKGAAAKAGG
jgi:acyl carrier protein